MNPLPRQLQGASHGKKGKLGGVFASRQQVSERSSEGMTCSLPWEAIAFHALRVIHADYTSHAVEEKSSLRRGHRAPRSSVFAVTESSPDVLLLWLLGIQTQRQ